MIIRVENVDDCKTCDNFLTLLIHDEKQYDETIDENFVVKDYFVNVIKNKDNILLLYKEGNNSIGYVFAKRVDDGYLLDGLYVDNSFRNKGIARKLLNEIIKEINLLGKYKIFINVLKENIVAYNLYKNLGFIIKEEDKLKYYMFYINCKQQYFLLKHL